MQWHLYIMVAIFAPLVQGQAYPTVAPCNDKIISSIKSFWESDGKPQNVLQGVEERGVYTVWYTSFNYFTSIIKCIHIKYTKGIFNIILVPKNGNTPATLTYIVEDGDEGVIKGKLPETDDPKYKWNWYPIYSDDDVDANYVCSDSKGSDQAPLVNIFVTNKHNNHVDSPKVEKFRRMLEGWGAQFKYSYGPECLLS